MTPAELAILQKNTISFISDRPSSITLTPRTKTETDGGGWRFDIGDPRDEQILRIIELGMLSTPPVVVLSNGKQRVVEYWLLGPHDADMEIWDFWEDGDKVWEIGHVVRDNGYETRGLVAERGE